MQFGSALYRSEAQAIAYAVKYMDVNRPNASAGRHHVPLCGRSIYERRMATQLDDFFPAQWDDAPELHSVVSSDNPVENGVAIAPVRPDFSHITNADFIAAVVQQPPEGASAAVCSKPGDPSDGGWRAVPFDKLAEPLPVTANNYFNCASFRPGQDGFKARKENFAATHFIMLDDIGSKVPVDRLGAFTPTWRLETSPGNFQVGIVLDPPITDQAQLTQLLNAIIVVGLCDPGATGPATRWARLPQAINGKPKYRSEYGEPFQCRLVEWAANRRYTVDEIVKGLGLPSLDAQHSAKSDAGRSPARPLNVPNDADSQEHILAELKTLLAALDPDCGYREWLNVLMGIYHSTNGSDDGLELAIAWSSTGNKYKGAKELEVKWRSFSNGTQNPVTIRTLRSMASSCGNAASKSNEILQEDDHGFEACETVVVHEPHPQQDQKKIAPHPLGKYSISDDIEALERQMVEQVPLLGNIALMGQATAIFAAPNTGKTLLTLRLLTDAIDKKSFDPKKVFYLNMDDNSKGLVEKVKIASEYGFEMLADGYKGFQSSDFRKAMEIMIENGTARGVAIVIDTLKKFTDTMDKGRSTDFSKVIRRFCLQGGTVIALGHTNKNPGANGKKVYAGTTDIVDDFDCAYILDTLKVQPEPGWKVVEFENIKRRGNVEETVAYRYRNEPGTRYDAMLLSVKEEDYSSLLQLKETAEIQSDMPVIVAIRDAIAEGINSKMKLIKAVSKAVALSERIVIGILEKYTGENPANHHWQFVVGARGAKTYALLGQDGEVVA